ncbi:MAG: 50S ribosomal protein L32e [Nanoarchaeota archaeon]
MTQLNTLLELRTKIKEKKPEFIRQDTHKRKKLSIKWRKPKGIHSKIRHHFKGRGKMPSPGYKSPRKTKGLHHSGLKMIRVFSPEDVKKVRKEIEGIVVPKNIGMKKRFEILKESKTMGISVLTLDIDQQLKNIDDLISSKKKKEAKDTKKDDVNLRTKEAKEKISESLSEENKKSMEKKEKDKILTKRT